MGEGIHGPGYVSSGENGRSARVYRDADGYWRYVVCTAERTITGGRDRQMRAFDIAEDYLKGLDHP